MKQEQTSYYESLNNFLCCPTTAWHLNGLNYSFISILKNLDVPGLMNCWMKCIRKYACPFFHPLLIFSDMDHLELTVVRRWRGKEKHRVFLISPTKKAQLQYSECTIWTQITTDGFGTEYPAGVFSLQILGKVHAGKALTTSQRAVAYQQPNPEDFSHCVLSFWPRHLSPFPLSVCTICASSSDHCS